MESQPGPPREEEPDTLVYSAGKPASSGDGGAPPQGFGEFGAAPKW